MGGGVAGEGRGLPSILPHRAAISESNHREAYSLTRINIFFRSWVFSFILSYPNLIPTLELPLL